MLLGPSGGGRSERGADPPLFRILSCTSLLKAPEVPEVALGLGFRVQGSGFRVEGLGFGFRV